MRENRFVVLGAGGVGKTSLVVQFLDGFFSSTYKPTVEDCYQHTIQLPDGISHTVEILDTAGSHHFPAMRELSIRSGRGFLLVFSVDSLQSFREAIQLGELIFKIRGPTVPIILVGNKTDLVKNRQVSHQMAAQAVSETLCKCRFMETSAKYNINVSELFLELLQLARDLEQSQDAQNGSRRTSKRLSRRLSCLSSLSFSLRRHSNPTNKDKSSTTIVHQTAEVPAKCVLL